MNRTTKDRIRLSVANSYRPGRPRLPVLGQGYLFPEAGSPGGRPKNVISQLLFTPQNSITTQFAVETAK